MADTQTTDTQTKEQSREAMLKLISEEPATVSAKPADDKAAKPDDSAPGGDGKAKSDGEPNQAPPGQGDTKPVTDERKAKEQERQDKSWKKLNEEKKAFAEEQAKRKADLEELEALRARKVQSETSAQAAEYERLASEFENEGNTAAAQLARNKASQARSEAEARLNEERGKRFMEQWRSNFDKVAESDPDLYDDSSTLYKAVENLLKAEPILRSMPDGISKAVTFVKNTIAAQSVDSLKADLAERDKRIEELTSKLTLGGSKPLVLGGAKAFDDMTKAEQRTYLLQQAAG